MLYIRMHSIYMIHIRITYMNGIHIWAYIYMTLIGTLAVGPIYSEGGTITGSSKVGEERYSRWKIV